jgi:PAS domain S-box-containing protein
MPVRSPEGKATIPDGSGMVDKAKQAESAIHNAEELFRSMADASPVMICCAGPDQRATFFNKSWLTFTGRTMDEELGSGWADGLHPDDRERALAAMACSFDARGHCYLEYRLRRADGEYRSVLCSGMPRFGAAGDFLGYVATCSDTTDARREEEGAVAREKLKSLGLLAKALAHDFNNLLGGILTSTEVALAEHADGSRVEEELQRIRIAAVQGAKIVHELTIYGDDESPTSEEVNLADLIEEMVPLLQLSVSKQVRLKFDAGQGLPVIQGNRGQLRQVLMNLVTNASDAIAEQNGAVCLNAAFLPGDKLPEGVSGLAPGDYVQLEICDTGAGMPPEVQAKIFDPFFTTKLNGRGLGLSVVQKILREHGAETRVVSNPGGTKFQIWFPTACESPAVAPPRPALVKPSSTARRVLLVDDEDILRFAVSKGLRKKGFEVLEACDGRGALEVVRSEAAIDIMLLDLVLRGMSSREVFVEARRIRPGLKVILISAHSEQTAMASFDSLPTDRFLRKPFHFKDLISCIEKVLLIQE